MANPICFRKNTNIGAADAESDNIYLQECFVETGDVEALLDCNNPQCIVLGRTGVGKTALLKKLASEREQVKELLPENLSLNYIVNSNVLKFFESIGVKLDIFYQLLWRHIITVELLKLRFNITNEQNQIAFLDRLKGLFLRDKAKERAFKYLQDWGDKFWEETEYRTKEFTQKLETDLKSTIGVDFDCIEMGAEGAQKLSNEQRVEVNQRATHVVNNVQIKELHEVIEFLAANVFYDDKKNYYLVIDKLDEGWVDDRLRFKLIKALIEAIKSFRKITTVKIVIALRTDLHYHMFRKTSEPGFQEEKFHSLYLPIRWTRDHLIKLLDARVSFMFRRQYTRDDVKLVDILPKNQIDKRDAADYVIDRTFFRPREAIIFLNLCIAKAEGSSRISIDLLRNVEIDYSRQRLESLAAEWRREYPLLSDCATFLLSGSNASFTLDEFEKEDIDRFATSILALGENTNDPVYRLCEEYYTSGNMSYLGVLEEVVRIFYQVGLVGIKTEPHLARLWSFDDQPILAKGQIRTTSTIDVHKTFRAGLGITTAGRRNARAKASRVA